MRRAHRPFAQENSLPAERGAGQVDTSGRNAQQVALEQAGSPSLHGGSIAAISIGVLGVVYGDIGTSPIYALRECFIGKAPIPVTRTGVLGILSLVLWTLLSVISLKYMRYVLQADNRGEGGTFALLALLRPAHAPQSAPRRVLMLVGLLGASMLFGGAMITPAISVLSAVEGLRVAAPRLGGDVIPVTIGILLALFAVQRHGTAKVGAVFGPVMLLWFAVLAALGIRGIVREPQVLLAVNPWYAVEFLREGGWTAYLVLYAVFLVTTGGEALYADLGHFGRQPIRRVWFAFVLPALLLDYFGQGGLLLENPGRGAHPFYQLAPAWGLFPLIVLATAATCIASQAVITGAFSLARQAVQLGHLPRLRVEQTSSRAHGQIYMPAVNWFLMAAAIGLVLIFRSSANLAAAYGVAVNSTMAITTVLAFNVARQRGGWSLPAALAFLVGFLAIDLGFLGSNLMRIPDGGWLPMLIGLGFFTLMTTWSSGARLLAERVGRAAPDVDTFLGRIASDPPHRVAGTAVFFTGRLDQTPPALVQLVRHTGMLHERVILLTVIIEPVAKTSAEERIEIKDLGNGFHRVVLHYGFMQGPNIPSELAAAAALGLQIDLQDVHYFIGQIDLFEGGRRRGMSPWRDRLFILMARNTEDATAYYQIPAAQAMTVGSQVGI
jgi:KUP system potassium uptake protein